MSITPFTFKNALRPVAQSLMAPIKPFLKEPEWKDLALLLNQSVLDDAYSMMIPGKVNLNSLGNAYFIRSVDPVFVDWEVGTTGV